MQILKAGGVKMKYFRLPKMVSLALSPFLLKANWPLPGVISKLKSREQNEGEEISDWD